MKPSVALYNFIRNKEGFRPVAYKPIPTDPWTIGHGFTTIYDTPVKEDDTMTLEESESFLWVRLNGLASSLSLKMSQAANANVTQQQFDAVLSLVFNIGLGAFTSSETGQMFFAGEDISNKFLKWKYSKGKMINGLLNRRLEEKKIYDNGIYT